jgi:hypothetical protein
MSEEPLCGKCGLPMHKDDARRYFGFYTAHMEDRCGTLLRAKIDDLEQKNVRLIDAIVRFHVKGDLSEGQAAKATGLYRIDLRERGRTMVRCDDGLDVRRVPDPACAEAADRIEALAAENAALREALGAASGYLLNAKIDLETGARKSTAITTIEGGLRRVRAALQETKP